MKPRCSTCGAEHERKGQRHCFTCKAAYMREWRKTHEMNEGQKRRDISRSIANVEKKRGNLEQLPCRVCGHEDSQMHHPDHELPRMVVWLCRPCHLAWHAHWRALALLAWQQWLSKNDRQEAA